MPGLQVEFKPAPHWAYMKAELGAVTYELDRCDRRVRGRDEALNQLFG